jgi:hypothetical protein
VRLIGLVLLSGSGLVRVEVMAWNKTELRNYQMTKSQKMVDRKLRHPELVEGSVQPAAPASHFAYTVPSVPNSILRQHDGVLVPRYLEIW